MEFRHPTPVSSAFGRALVFTLLVMCLAIPWQESTADEPPTPTIMVARINGAIGPVTYEYVRRVMEAAKTELPTCIVFEMDTPGGLDTSMRSIIKDILASPVPIVIYVGPSGARAASAGAIISLSAHIAAMAPGTNMGAAHPVSVGGGGQMDSTMSAKVTNDAAAFARGLANKRGRDVKWAEQIVRESISSTAEELLELGVIDIIATNMDELTDALDGRSVKLDSGEEVILQTTGAEMKEMPPSWRENVLSRIADPNIAYLLMLLGIFGIFFELQNPGALFPGIIGAISILLAFFALQVLPINYAGLALILLAIVLFALEIKIPSGGLLTVGGIVSMVIGSIMFIDSPLPFMRVSLKVIIPAVIFTALFFLFAVGMGMRAQRQRVATGNRAMQGEVGEAKTDIGKAGSVFVHGEHWNAYSDEPIAKGERVEIISVDGLKAKVRRHAR